MDSRNNVTPFAKDRIDEYDNINNKNRVCVFCGFENTIPYDNFHRYCNMCGTKYDLLTKNNKCCIIL